MQWEPLYKRDSKGNLRVWWMEQEGGRYRTVAGLAHGKHVTSEWTDAESKNVGKSNETTPEAQATAEIQATYDLKLRKDYHKSPEDVDQQKYFKPMLAKDYAKEKKRIKWDQPVYVQPKLDGIRCIAMADGLWSRTGKPIEAVPHIFEALVPLFEADPDLVLDGELYNHDLRDNFNDIVSMVRKHNPTPAELAKAASMVEYHVYDLPSHPGSFSERYQSMLSNGYGKTAGPIRLVDSTLVLNEDDCDEVYAGYVAKGYEGGIIRLDGPYEQKRSSLLLKRKDFMDDEFTIVDIEEGRGNWSGVAKVVYCELNDGRIFKATIQGSKEYAKHVLDNRADYIGKQVTVAYFALTPDGIPRFPIAKRLHNDERW